MGHNTFEIIRPKALSPGDTIGIAAPAGGFDRERFRQGLAVLESLGYKVMVPPDIYQQKRYLAGEEASRAAIVNALFADAGIRAIFCARGGFGSLRLLPWLDYDLIRQNPKIMAGFSDITVLLSVLGAQTGLVTFHAPVVTALAAADVKTRSALAAALDPDQVVTLRPENPEVLFPGRARGPVVGGNLASLCHLLGTGYQPDWAGCLLFLEETAEAAYRIDRMLTQMRLAGCLEQLAGVMLGRFDACEPAASLSEIFGEHLPRDIPVLAGFDIGHGGVNLTLPLGLVACLDAEAGFLAYESPAVWR